MKTFIANLKHAIRNKETVTIGGGDFSPRELKAVLTVLEAVQSGSAAEADSGLSETEEARRGQLIANTFLLRKDLPDHPDRYKATTGNKTAIGVFRTMKRLVEDGE